MRFHFGEVVQNFKLKKIKDAPKSHQFTPLASMVPRLIRSIPSSPGSARKKQGFPTTRTTQMSMSWSKPTTRLLLHTFKRK